MAYKFVNIDQKFNIEKNFWEDNIHFKYIDPYKQLYDRDTSDNHKASSDEMWCIWLSEDPSYINKIGKLRIDEKKSSILDYCPTFDFEDPIIIKCLLKYNEQHLSEAARSFKRTISNIEKYQVLLDELMDNEELTLDTLVEVAPKKWVNKKGTATQILDIKKKLSQLWQEYDKVRNMFEEEQGTMQLYGGGKPTIIEEGSLIDIPDDE